MEDKQLSPPQGPPNSEDMAARKERELYFKQQLQEALKTLDPLKRPSAQVQTYSKETLRTYMQNPQRYYKQLCGLSRYLRNRSQVYKKIIYDNATMIDTCFRNVIPNIDLNKKETNATRKKILKQYTETLSVLDSMNLPSEMLKVYLECWTVDVFYGVYYYFKDEGGIMLPLDPDYCQIIGLYPTGDFMFAFDMSYFRSHQEYLEMWGEPFQSMYKEYQKDQTNNRWLQVPDEYACCMKVNIDDYLTPIPPYITLFNSLINLEDLKEITAIADEEQIYKLIAFKMDTASNSNQVDDFKVDPKTASSYYNKMLDALPDNVSAILSPLDIQTITFDNDQATDVNKVENSSKNILKTAGHSALAEPEGTTATVAAIRSDEEYVISSLLPQTQAWVNRMLTHIMSNPCKVKFLEVTKYTRTEYKDSILKDMNYGLPMITTLGVLNGFSELELINMANMNNVLGLDGLFKPYQTAATRSSEDTKNGRPENDSPTDESDSSKEERERNG